VYPRGQAGIATVSSTRSVRVSINVTESLFALATAARRPSGRILIRLGCRPVGISAITENEARSITDTLPVETMPRESTTVFVPAEPAVASPVSGRRPPQLVTKSRFVPGAMATSRGAMPTFAAAVTEFSLRETRTTSCVMFNAT
jgi:hypothetical protein